MLLITTVKKLSSYDLSSIFCEFSNFAKCAPLWFTAESQGKLGPSEVVTSAGEARSIFVFDMPDRCVAANCSNVADPSRRIFVHTIPFFGDSRPEAIKRRKKWVDFVKMKRAKWEPTKYSALCSKHFTAEDYVFQYTMVPGNSKPSVPRLKRDNVGILAFPTIQAAVVDKSVSQSERTKRKV